MAKTFGIVNLFRRNDRILKAAFGGTLLYALTVAAVTPALNAATAPADAAVVMRLSKVIDPREAPGSQPLPVTVVREEILNRPAYQAYLREKDCLATAIYFEARGESAKGQKAVAEVVLARTRVPGRPSTICGVVYEGSKRRTGCQFSFTCDGVADRVRSGDAWRQANRIAANVMRTGGKVNQVAGGATFYHADYVSPGWASRMVKVAEIGTHIFYRPQRGRNL
ncbi:MAG: cell wall hydrolase [Alphaproteobacteria bacterium]|nr:cell wall hydrolase [Alphaproteobacteria bacterium]